MAAVAGTEGVAERPTPMMAQYLKSKAPIPASCCLTAWETSTSSSLMTRKARGAWNCLTKRGKHLVLIFRCAGACPCRDQYLQNSSALNTGCVASRWRSAEAKKRGSNRCRRTLWLVTPGTLTEDTLLESRTSNYIAALAATRGTQEMALSWADISSGEFSVLLTNHKQLAAELARLEPREIIFGDNLLSDGITDRILRDTGVSLSPLPALRFDSTAAEKRLKEHFGVLAFDGFGTFSRRRSPVWGTP